MAYGSYHPIWFAGDNLGDEQDLIIAGPVCESGDVLTQENEEPVPRRLPMPEPGILLSWVVQVHMDMSCLPTTTLSPCCLKWSSMEIRLCSHEEGKLWMIFCRKSAIPSQDRPVISVPFSQIKSQVRCLVELGQARFDIFKGKV